MVLLLAKNFAYETYLRISEISFFTYTPPLVKYDNKKFIYFMLFNDIRNMPHIRSDLQTYITIKYNETQEYLWIYKCYHKNVLKWRYKDVQILKYNSSFLNGLVAFNDTAWVCICLFLLQSKCSGGYSYMSSHYIYYKTIVYRLSFLFLIYIYLGTA